MTSGDMWVLIYDVDTDQEYWFNTDTGGYEIVSDGYDDGEWDLDPYE